MPTQPIEIDRDEWGMILHHPDHAALELKWYSATQRMTDEDFKASLERYADAADRLKPMPRLLIDSREFLHSFGDPGVLPWRKSTLFRATPRPAFRSSRSSCPKARPERSRIYKPCWRLRPSAR